MADFLRKNLNFVKKSDDFSPGKIIFFIQS